MREETASEEEWRTIISTTDNGMVGHPLPLVKWTGTRDLIWLKVISLDRSWLVGLTDEH